MRVLKTSPAVEANFRQIHLIVAEQFDVKHAIRKPGKPQPPSLPA